MVDTAGRVGTAMPCANGIFGQHQRAFNMLNCFLAVKSFFSVNPFVCLIPINTTTIIIYVSFSPTIGTMGSLLLYTNIATLNPPTLRVISASQRS